MDASILFTLVLLVAVVYALSQMVRIVPQGEEWVAERLGKYNTTLLPGLHLLIPVVYIIAYKIMTKELIQQTREQEVITNDNNRIIFRNNLLFTCLLNQLFRHNLIRDNINYWN